MSGLPDAMEVDQSPHRPMGQADADKMGLVEGINPLVPTEMEVDAGTGVLGMVWESRSGRRPLDRLEEFFAPDDTARLWGRALPPPVLNADQVGRVLARLDATGTLQICTACAGRAAMLVGCDKPYGHVDTTAQRVSGDDRPGDGPEGPCSIPPGSSQETRPDLTPCVVSLRCVERAVPRGGQPAEGTAADQPRKTTVGSEIAPRVAHHGVAPGASIDSADAALVTEDQRMARRAPVCSSRVPATDAEGEGARVIPEAVAPPAWTEGGVLAPTKPTKHRPRASDQASERAGTRAETSDRAVVVQASALEKRRHTRRDRACQASAPTVHAALRAAEPQVSGCRAEAEAAATTPRALQPDAHRVDVTGAERPQDGQGRPRTRQPRAVHAIRDGLKPGLTARAARLATKREDAGGGVRRTHVPQPGACAHRAGDVLQAEKAPQGVEQHGGCLKAPVSVNRRFLKQPERLAAFGLV